MGRKQKKKKIKGPKTKYETYRCTHTYIYIWRCHCRYPEKNTILRIKKGLY